MHLRGILTQVLFLFNLMFFDILAVFILRRL